MSRKTNRKIQEFTFMVILMNIVTFIMGTYSGEGINMTQFWVFCIMVVANQLTILAEKRGD